MNHKRKVFQGFIGLLLAAVMLAGGIYYLTGSSLQNRSLQPWMQGNTWQVGSPVTITLSVDPQLSGRWITAQLLSLGPDPGFAGLDPDFFALAGVQFSWLTDEQRPIEAELAAASGARTLGLDFDWRKIQPEQGRYDWERTDAIFRLAKKHELRLVPMLLFTPLWASSRSYAPLDYHISPPSDYKQFRNFAYAVVNRYKPYGILAETKDGYGITDWVIWNEPNVRPVSEAPIPGNFWTGSIDEYVELLRAGYEGAHAADPGCNVLNGGLADVYWEDGRADLITSLEQLYDPNHDGNTADGGRPFFDTLNIHIYPPDQPDGNWYHNRMEYVIRLMERFGDEQKPIWITETGYGSVPHNETGQSAYLSEAEQADAVEMVYHTLAGYPQIERVFWWSLRDYYSNAWATNAEMEAHFGLLRADFSPKPAYFTYARLTGKWGEMFTLPSRIDDEGLAHITIPASLTGNPGKYLIYWWVETNPNENKTNFTGSTNGFFYQVVNR